MVRRIVKYSICLCGFALLTYSLCLLLLGSNPISIAPPEPFQWWRFIELARNNKLLGSISSGTAAASEDEDAAASAPTTINSLHMQRLFHQHPKLIDKDPKERMKSLSAFEMQMNIEERDAAYDLLNLFDRVMTAHGLPYVMYGGTLLGSYRHLDFIPWDDDIDVITSEAHREQMKKLFKVYEPHYRLVRGGPHDKLFRADGKASTGYSWLWPYVDISYYTENATHITDIAKVYGYQTTFPKSVVFPLRRRPFFNLTLSAPADSFASLVWTYGDGVGCKMFGYSHIVEGRGPYGRLASCESFGNTYPFVYREALTVEDRKSPVAQQWNASTGVKEILKVGPLEVRRELMDEPSYALTEPFVLKLKKNLQMPKHVPMPTP